MAHRIIGVGYQGATPEALAEQLAGEGVGTLVDVRLTPMSRKRGFSKNVWAAILREHGIEYVYLAALGNPRENRAGFTAGPDTESGRAAHERYRALLDTEPAAAALDEIVALAAEAPVAVMCFEDSAEHCHRSEVLRAVAARLEARS